MFVYVRLILTLHANFVCMSVNRLKPSVVMWLHFECSAPYRSNLPFLISDIQALWCSGLSARVPECQKLKMVGWACMAKCNNLRASPPLQKVGGNVTLSTHGSAPMVNGMWSLTVQCCVDVRGVFASRTCSAAAQAW